MISASLDDRAENVRVLPIVVSEFKFFDVQRQIFRADFLERADDSALDEAPESFDGVRMNRAVDVFARAVTHHADRIFEAKSAVSRVLISAKQTDLVRYGFADEFFDGAGFDVLDDSGDHVTLAAHGSRDYGFAGADAASPATAALIPMLVFRLAANKSFVHFHEADQLPELLIAHCHANLVAHFVSGMVGAEAHHAHDLERGNALLAGEHQIDDLEPNRKLNVRVLEDRADQHREAVAIGR